MRSSFNMLIPSVSLVLLLFVASGAIAQNNLANATEDPTKVWVHFDVGQIKMAVSYDTSKPNGKMILSRTTLNWFVVNDRAPYYHSLLKSTQQEELVACNAGLVPERPEMWSLVDCKPLVHINDLLLDDLPEDTQSMPKQILESAKKYAKVSKYRSKSKLGEYLMFKSFMKPRNEWSSYPLASEFTDQSIKRALLENNMTASLGFVPGSARYGRHIVLKSEDVYCGANLFLAFNKTESELQFEFRPDILNQFNESTENGVFISLQEVSCTNPASAWPFSIDMDFTFIYRKEFPYITCTHNIVTKPMTALWNYAGLIRQVRSEQQDGSSTQAYNTTIKVQSRSIIAKMFNLVIDQTFVNNDWATGSERMSLVTPSLATMVHSMWSPKSLVKTMLLFFVDMENVENMETNLKNPYDNPDVVFNFVDKPEEEFVIFKLKIARDLLKGLVVPGQPELYGSNETPELEQAHLNLMRHIEL